MKKMHKSNLMITVLCTLIVGISLYFLYDTFYFQTYGTKTYYDYLLSIDSKECQLSDFKLFKDQSNYYCGDGSITLGTIDTLQIGQEYTISIVLNSQGKNYTVDYPIVYDKDCTYALNNNETRKDLKTIDSIKLHILDSNDQVVYTKKVKKHAVQAIYCFNKEYRIENACISDDFMRLGYLTTTNDKIIKQYPYISLEYRYLKDEKGDEEDDNNYIVFKKITGLSKDYVNIQNYETYQHDKEKRGSLLDKQLSVVIIFSNEEGKTFTFKMDFTNEAGE